LRHLAGLLEKHLVHAGLGIRPVNVKTIAVDALHILIHPGAGLVLSPAHQYGILIVRAARRPHDHLLALPADMLRHTWDKILHGNVRLVGSHVEKPPGKQGNGLVHDILQYGNTLLRLHAGLHGPGKRLAVSRHVNLRNHLDIQPGAIIRQILQLSLCIKPPREPGLPMKSPIRQGRILLHFQPPCGIIRQMKMQRINLIAGKTAHHLLDQGRRHVITPHIQHNSPQDESGFVTNTHNRHGKFPFSIENQLPQRLKSVKKTAKTSCPDGCFSQSDGQVIPLSFHPGVRKQFPCHGTFSSPPTIQGTLNAGSPEYVLDLLHQIIPARNIRTNLHMNAPETCLARAPDDFGRIWNKRGGRKLRHRRGNHPSGQRPP